MSYYPYYPDRSRGKRIFILLLIIICVIAIFFFLFKTSYIKKDSCEKCVCAGMLTGETIQISFNPKNATVYSCQGVEYCWEINETKCS